LHPVCSVWLAITAIIAMIENVIAVIIMWHCHIHNLPNEGGPVATTWHNNKAGFHFCSWYDCDCALLLSNMLNCKYCIHTGTWGLVANVKDTFSSACIQRVHLVPYDLYKFYLHPIANEIPIFSGGDSDWSTMTLINAGWWEFQVWVSSDKGLSSDPDSTWVIAIGILSHLPWFLSSIDESCDCSYGLFNVVINMDSFKSNGGFLDDICPAHCIHSYNCHLQLFLLIYVQESWQLFSCQSQERKTRTGVMTVTLYVPHSAQSMSRM
jgi:hypothetical protein